MHTLEPQRAAHRAVLGELANSVVGQDVASGGVEPDVTGHPGTQERTGSTTPSSSVITWQ